MTAGTFGDRPSPAQWAAIEARREGLIGLAEGILRNRHDAEDVVQETLVAVWTRSAQSAPRNLEAYVRRAVYLNALKRRARRRATVALEGAPASALTDAGGPSGDDPFEIAPGELEEALGGLPEAQQAVIRMKYYLAFSFRQIGLALSISQNTAASWCRYALKALRRALARD